MPCLTKKFLCTTAITTILNLSFQPAYAVKIELLNDVQVEENHSYSRPLMKEDPSAETVNTSAPVAQTWMPEIIKEAGSYYFSALKGLMQLPRLASKGVIYAVKHPMEVLTLGLVTQVTTASALNAKRATGDEFQINQIITTIRQYSHGSPLVASLTNGNVFVVWDERAAGVGEVYGRVFSANGVPLDNEFRIDQGTTGWYPSVASLTNGNVFVVYQARSGKIDIIGQVLSANGTAISNEFIINQNTTGDSVSAGKSVASLTNGNVFVTWQFYQAGNFGIYGRVLFPNGTALSNEFNIGGGNNPSVASLANGNAFVAWQGFAPIYGRVFFPNGTALSNEYNINQQLFTSTNLNPSVTGLTNGNAFVAWVRQTGVGNFGIYGRVLFPNGTALSNEFNIGGGGNNPSVASLTNGNVFVAWSGGDIYGRLFSANGVPLDNYSTIINQVTTGSQLYPSVAGLANGNAFVVWQGSQLGVSPYYYSDVYGRILISAASPSSPVSTTTGGPLAASEASSQSLSSWLAGAALLIGQERL